MADMTNESLGELIGLTHSAVSRLLSGDRTPSPDTMKRISVAFEVDLGDVLRAATQSDDSGTRCDLWGRYFRILVQTADLQTARERVAAYEAAVAV